MLQSLSHPHDSHTAICSPVSSWLVSASLQRRTNKGVTTGGRAVGCVTRPINSMGISQMCTRNTRNRCIGDSEYMCASSSGFGGKQLMLTARRRAGGSRASRNHANQAVARRCQVRLGKKWLEGQQFRVHCSMRGLTIGSPGWLAAGCLPASMSGSNH